MRAGARLRLRLLLLWLWLFHDVARDVAGQKALCRRGLQCQPQHLWTGER